ncbi:PQQ-dependent sugar dehydrogenase [Pelagicoccus mobilis]|uniref:PQQ-dependent sugar dehydrogenase n=1 Tax=Pelagicoccus mobilis TaxID=415221 RepID=A0A934S2Z2_9BACT|nr:PQQ-dependent sugar dehydrogenase [Pelagicoccus mobilis]MBK1880139.1 PQQ-dependent sugar dehydrogenase [Pelagicoccus mobilis]
MNRFILLFSLAVWPASLGFAQSSTQFGEEADVLKRGGELFETLCASCHSFERDAIGPALGGVFDESEKAWLFRFIRDPQAVIDSGDERAKQLNERFSSVMPSFGLSDDDIEAVLAYLYANRMKASSEAVGQGGERVGLKDPIPGGIERSDLILELEVFARVPPSSDTIPVARINKLAGVFDHGRERIFVNDQRGVLYEIFEGEVRVFLDLARARPGFVHRPGLATGFSSFAFSPDFEEDGLLYTQHAEAGDAGRADFALPPGRKAKLQYVVTEWRVDSGNGEVMLDGSRELFRIEMVDTSHGMQELVFNPHLKKGDAAYGLLHIGIGDGGASYIGRTDLISGAELAWGTIFRIDPKGGNGRNGEYGIPDLNPFVGHATALPEIYAYGFRNPNVLSWDSGGRFFVADIGHWQIEELNRVEAGKDYGWPYLEGTFEIDLNGDQSQVYPRSGNYPDAVDPLLQIDHDEMMAIAGGFVYEGDRLSDLTGYYLFGDIATGRVLVASELAAAVARVGEVQVSLAGEITRLAELAGNERADLRIGRDASGEPYLMSKTTGVIWKVVGTRRGSP